MWEDFKFALSCYKSTKEVKRQSLKSLSGSRIFDSSSNNINNNCKSIDDQIDPAIQLSLVSPDHSPFISSSNHNYLHSPLSQHQQQHPSFHLHQRNNMNNNNRFM